MTSEAPSPQAEEKPGKLRTWWHPLLVSVLRWLLDARYEIRDEITVGKMPLRVDVALIDQRNGELTDEAKKMLAGLIEYFNDVTMIELKAPTDTLALGDTHSFLQHALLFRGNYDPMLDPKLLNLILLAPTRSQPFEDEARVLGIKLKKVKKGVWQLKGQTLGHKAYLLETEELAGAEHPLLTVISPWILKKPHEVFDALKGAGFETLFVFLAQQIQQFQSLGKDFIMQHLGASTELVEVLKGCLPYMTVEDRLWGLSPAEVAKTLPPAERVKGLPPAERVKGLSGEELVEGLSTAELERLLELRKRAVKPNASDTSSS